MSGRDDGGGRDPSLDPATIQEGDPETAALLSEVLRVAGEGGDTDALVAAHPEHADKIHGWLETIARVGLGAGVGGSPAVAGDPLPAPGAPAIGGYTVLGELARGAMGVVYRARHHALGREVALKVLRVERLVAAAQSRFQKEAQAAARLRHPRIVSIHDVGEDAHGRPYYTMDLIEGRSLAELLRDDPGRMSADRAATIVRKVAEALDYAHQEGIVHRDLKPGNIMIDREGEVFVTDFGLARDLHDLEHQTRTGDVLGTPAYMSPEQTIGDPELVDPRSDVWALGVVLYELLAGRRPLEGAGISLLTRIGDEAPPHLSKVAPSVPKDLAVVAHKALEPDKERRYRTAGAMAEDLARWAASEPILARAPGLVYVTTKWARRHPFRLVSAALVLVALAVGGLFVAERRADARRRTAREQVAEAEVARAAGRWDTVRDRAARALVLDPDAKGARALLARARLALGEPEGALTALAGAPALTEVETILRAQALFATGRPAEALDALAPLPDASAPVVAARADALAALGRADEAGEARKRAAALYAEASRRDVDQARAALAAGDRDRAKALVSGVLARWADHPGALETEAALRLAAGDATGAEALIDGLGRPSGFGHRVAARAAMALGRPDRAVARLAPLGEARLGDPDLAQTALEAQLQVHGAAFFRDLAPLLEPGDGRPGGQQARDSAKSKKQEPGTVPAVGPLAALDRIALDARALRQRHPDHAGGFVVGARVGLLFRGVVLGTVEEDHLAALAVRHAEHVETAHLIALAADLLSTGGPAGRPFVPLNRLGAHEETVGAILGLPSPSLLLPPPLAELAARWRDGDAAAGAALAVHAESEPIAVQDALRAVWAGVDPRRGDLADQPLDREVSARVLEHARARLEESAQSYDPGSAPAAEAEDGDVPAPQRIGDVESLSALAQSDGVAWRAAVAALLTHGDAGRAALVRLASRSSERVALAVGAVARLENDADLLDLLRARPEPTVQAFLDAAAGTQEQARVLDLLSPSDSQRKEAIKSLLGSWGMRLPFQGEFAVIYWWFPEFLAALQPETAEQGLAPAAAWLDAHRPLLQELAPKVDGSARLALSLVLARAGDARDLELLVRLAAAEHEPIWRDSLLLHALLHASDHPDHAAAIDLDRPGLHSQGSRFLLAGGAWDKGLGLLRKALQSDLTAEDALDWLAVFPAQTDRLHEADDRIPPLTTARRGELAALVATCLDRGPLTKQAMRALTALEHNPLPEAPLELLGDPGLRAAAVRLLVATAAAYSDDRLAEAANALEGSSRWAISACRVVRPGSPAGDLDALLATSVAWDDVLDDLALRILREPSEGGVALAAALLLRQPGNKRAHQVLVRLAEIDEEVLVAGLARAAAAPDPITRLGAVYALAAIDTGILSRVTGLLKLPDSNPMAGFANTLMAGMVQVVGGDLAGRRVGLPEALEQALATDAYLHRGALFASLEIARCLFAAEHGITALAPSLARTAALDPMRVAYATKNLSASGSSGSDGFRTHIYGYDLQLGLELHLSDLAAWTLARLRGRSELYPVPLLHLTIAARRACRDAVLALESGAAPAGPTVAPPIALVGFRGSATEFNLGLEPGDLVHAVDGVPVALVDLPLLPGEPDTEATLTMSRGGFHFVCTAKRDAVGQLPFRVGPDPLALFLGAVKDAAPDLQLAFGPEQASALVQAVGAGVCDAGTLRRFRLLLAGAGGYKALSDVPTALWLELLGEEALFDYFETFFEAIAAPGQGLFRRHEPYDLRRDAEPLLRFASPSTAQVEDLVAGWSEAEAFGQLVRLRAITGHARGWLSPDEETGIDGARNRARMTETLLAAFQSEDARVRAAALLFLEADGYPLLKPHADVFAAALARLDDPARPVRLLVGGVFARGVSERWLKLDEGEVAAITAAFTSSDDPLLRASLAAFLPRDRIEAWIAAEPSPEVRRALYVHGLRYPIRHLAFYRSEETKARVLAATASLLPRALDDEDEGVRALGLFLVFRIALQGEQDERRSLVLAALPRVLGYARDADSERERRRAYWTLARTRKASEGLDHLWVPRGDGTHVDLITVWAPRDETERVMEDWLAWLPPPAPDELATIAAWVDEVRSE